MAARVTASAVDFAALASKIPAQQSNAFVALKGKVEGHLRNVNTLPAALPAIDFSAYSKVTVPGMVDNFQKKYEALTIPYPSDQGSLKGKIVCIFIHHAVIDRTAIDDQAAEQKAAFTAFCAESNSRIGELKVELAKWEAMKPVEEMNLEEALDAGLVGTVIKGIPHPDHPSFWPHQEVRITMHTDCTAQIG